MPEIRLPGPGEAEEQLLELIRLRDVQDFTVSITCVDGGWTVAVADPTGESPSSTIGRGDSFDAAWFGQDPAGARGQQKPDRILYESPNGDTWHLIKVGGEPMVRHVPNGQSGGRTSEVRLGAFLSASHYGPEHRVLLQLVIALGGG